MELTENAKVVLLLCCPFQAQTENEEKSQVLSTKQWHELAHRLEQKHLEPQALLNFKQADLQELLQGHKLYGEVDKISRLLYAGGDLGFHMEILNNQGINVITVVDEEYPARLKERLKEKAPPFLFYAGDLELLGQPGIAVVGSRNIDETVTRIAQELGEICGQSGKVLYSGGAKGVDQTCMKAALKLVDGHAVGILAHPLTEAIRTVEYRKGINQKHLCLVTPFMPDKGFQIWKAMARNKIIYALADYAVVIQSELEKGGTWQGAQENLANHWVPLFVIEQEGKESPGNSALIRNGGIRLPYPFPFDRKTMMKWFEENSWTKGKEGTSSPSSVEKSSKNRPQGSSCHEQGKLF